MEDCRLKDYERKIFSLDNHAEKYVKECKTCQKKVDTYVSNGPTNWCYKLLRPGMKKGESYSYRYFCSYTCQCKYEREHPYTSRKEKYYFNENSKTLKGKGVIK